MTAVPEPDDRLSGYLDDELDAAERAEVEALLAQSPAWRDTLAEVAWARDAVRGLPVRDRPVSRAPGRGGRTLRVLGVSAAAAAAIAVFAVPLDKPEGGGGGGGTTAGNETTVTGQVNALTGDDADDDNAVERVVDALVEPFDW